ncbi:hypothetical protein [Longimicrobium sp.]|uniref:hypothetical protein n=1 Tax=Longimicrobium sp. TaxID=2029185 RepID=UPI002F959A52
MKLSSVLWVVLLAAACAGRTAGPPPELPAAAPPVPAAGGAQRINLCVVENGTLRVLDAVLDPSTGDTLVEGASIREVFANQTEYAAAKPWFVNNEPITWERRVYTKYGPPRVVSPSQLRPGGHHGGVVFFVEANAGATPEVIFVPTRPGCEFHWYQWERTTGGVRG